MLRLFGFLIPIFVVALPLPVSAQITATGDCTVVISRSAARSVAVTGCSRSAADFKSLENMLNQILASEAIAISKIDDMIADLNTYFAASTARETETLELSYVISEDVKEVLQFLESFKEKPEEAAGLIGVLRQGDLSELQKKRPFGIQIVNKVRYTSGHIRIIMRLVPTGDDVFQVAVRKERYNNPLLGWRITGVLGTSCRLYPVYPSFTIASASTESGFAKAVAENESTSDRFPQTLIVSADCTGYVHGDDLTLTMRFHYADYPKTETAKPVPQWQSTDFRFDVSKITQLVLRKD